MKIHISPQRLSKIAILVILSFGLLIIIFDRNNLLPIVTKANWAPVLISAGSIVKCNTWRSRKGTGTLSGYGKTIQAFEHR